MSEPTCETCRFSSPAYAVGWVVCRRFPPTLMKPDWDPCEASWPQLPNEERCGEHEPRDPAIDMRDEAP